MENPRRILMIDALGAFVTFLVTALLLATEWIPTGLPVTFLTLMAYIASGFCFIGVVALTLLRDLRVPLRLLSVLNFTYCMTTVAFCVMHSSTLTFWGFNYFLVEVIVVSILALWEWKVSSGTTAALYSSSSRWKRAN